MSPKVISKSWDLSQSLSGAKAASSKGYLAVSQVKKSEQNIPGRKKSMSKASEQRWILGSLPSSANIPLFNNKNHEFHCRKWGLENLDDSPSDLWFFLLLLSLF